MQGEYKRRYEAHFMPTNCAHRARQYNVTPYMEEQIPSKLFDSMDDKLSVSGMHKNRMFYSLWNKKPNIKAWSHMLNQKTTTPEYDINRIDSIRTQLNEDDYFVDTLQIADKFIDMEIALAGSTWQKHLQQHFSTDTWPTRHWPKHTIQPSVLDHALTIVLESWLVDSVFIAFQTGISMGP